MTDSDITGNITADCGQVPQGQEMIEGHEAGCTCNCCCELSESNCQDNLDQCEQAQQPSGGMTRMKSKLTPIMANCAVLLAILALSGLVARGGNIRSADTIHINPAIDNQIADTDAGIVTRINHPAIIRGYDVIDANDIELIDTNIAGVGAIEISNLNSQIAINVDTVVDIDEAISPIDSAESNYINASLDRDILPAIRT